MFRGAYHPEVSGHSFMLWHFMGFLFLLFILSLIFHVAVRHHRRKYGYGFHSFHGYHGCHSNHHQQHANQVLDLLNTRYVNGEISEEEYIKIKAHITQ